MKLLNNIPSFVRNKYLLSLSVFTIWMLFFDSQDIITTHFTLRHELHQLEESRNHFLREIESTRNELDQLRSDRSTLEKYAREKYYMKKDNEDLFIISE